MKRCPNCMSEFHGIGLLFCGFCGTPLHNLITDEDVDKASKEIGDKLALLSEIGELQYELKTVPFYKISKRRDIKLKIRELWIQK